MSITPSLIQKDQNVVAQESDGLDKHQNVSDKPDIVIKQESNKDVKEELIYIEDATTTDKDDQKPTTTTKTGKRNYQCQTCEE